MKTSLSLIAMVLLVVSCSEQTGNTETQPTVNQELSARLIGEWMNTGTKIEMQSYKNHDSVKVFNMSPEEWEKRMGLRPVKTIFWKTGSYCQVHSTLKDSLIESPAGKWMVIADTLHMKDTFPRSGKVYKYKIRINSSAAEWWSKEDCDGDGKEDDLYYATHKKM